MADNETPADDLRSLISASFDDSAAAATETAAPVKTAVETPVEKPEAAEAAAAKDAKRDRAADGKFVKKEGETEPEAKAADKEKPEAKDAKPEAKKEGETEPKADDKTAAVDDKGAPATWSASDKAMFALQSPEAKEFLVRRHKQMEADYTKKLAPLADLKKEFEPIAQMFAPHLDVLKAKGLSPASTIRAWANVETALANGKGIDVIRGMIDGYRIDKAALGRALGFTSTTADQPSTETAKAATDPASTAHQPIALPPELTQELQALRARLDAQDNEKRNNATSAARDREAKAESDITNFKSATNEKGELLHPYFEEVESAMLALAQGYVASKQPLPPLSELYENAVWANTSTRTAMQAAQRVADDAKRTEEARAKAASARRAGSSVTGAPGSGQASTPIRGEMSLREQLEEAAAE